MEEANKDSDNSNFVTVVSIGSDNDEEKKEATDSSGDSEFVTVLRIGEKAQETEDIVEEVLVYRLPGERLGFGLKFEGGTKATECVKRLFVQSCAPDSPASRVLSSWGSLIEGDEVLVIDSKHVTSMTRMDCVKCLKDSNVIIKLLVRHFKQQDISNLDSSNDAKNKVGEDLPQVISAEKKKVPPPPPPVPPRKVPRKLIKTNQSSNNVDNQPENSPETNPMPPVRQKYADANNNANKTKSTKIKSNSPEVKRSRKYSDGSTGPPDAEIYTDLFSQESFHSLSESDDTASTISTVIDRNGSSLPSTPKSIQKHLDISNFPDDDELFNITSGGSMANDKAELSFIEDQVNDVKMLQDLGRSHDEIDSYGEIKTPSEVIAEYKIDDLMNANLGKNLPDDSKISFIQAHDENMNIFSLPRLVDFVPKTGNDADQVKMMNMFLDSERSEHYDFGINLGENNYTVAPFDDDIHNYPKWSVSSQLATIGEVEEDSSNFESLTDGSTTATPLPTPIVIVQDADELHEKKRSDKVKVKEEEPNRTEQIMEPLPSDPRQPPDGHEFPDFDERLLQPNADSLLETFRLNFTQSTAQHNIKPNIYRHSSFEIHSSDSFGSHKINSMSNTDLSVISKDRGANSPKNEDKRTDTTSIPLLSTRSQSLCDISIDKRQNDQWNNLVEQRRKSLSKLKGLVIPDSISENDCSSTINLPEIKSCSSVSIETFNSLESSEASNETSQPSSVDSSKFPLISPPWAETVNFPKYSPAFKRKDLQIYSMSKQDNDKSNLAYKSLEKRNSLAKTESSSGDDIAAMQSADSSPTRSESSFDGTPKIKPKQKMRPPRSYSMDTSILGSYQKNKKEINVEEESDNDSAVSSSQSSFASRPTTSPSPTRSIELDSNSKTAQLEYRAVEGRHLKPASVEAINRKNILASSKCRSGKDFKVGSPVINRKLDEPEEKTEEEFELKTMESVEKKEVTPVVKVRTQYNSAADQIEKGNTDKPSTKQVVIVQPPPRRSLPEPVQQSPTTASLKTKFETTMVPQATKKPNFTRSISKDSAPVFKDMLKPIPTVLTKREEKVSRFASSKSLSVTDLRKNFEDIAKSVPVPAVPKLSTEKPNVAPRTRKSESNLEKASKIPTLSIQKIAEEKPASLVRKEKLPDPQVPIVKSLKVTLKPDEIGTNLGIALDGGIDEDKHITIHRIRYGSVAYQEGTLTKGDHILSINGVDTKNLSHLEAVELLKAPMKSITIHIALRAEKTKDDSTRRKSTAESSTFGKSNQVLKTPNHEIVLQKDGNGLGFSIEGGRDSPQGDVPLIVKKIFQGGVAEKDGRLKVGDEIISMNEIDFTKLSRIQAWTMMKKIEIGTTKILIYR